MLKNEYTAIIKEKINEYHGTNLQGNPIDQPDSVSDDGLL